MQVSYSCILHVQIALSWACHSAVCHHSSLLTSSRGCCESLQAALQTFSPCSRSPQAHPAQQWLVCVGLGSHWAVGALQKLHALQGILHGIVAVPCTSQEVTITLTGEHRWLNPNSDPHDTQQQLVSVRDLGLLLSFFWDIWLNIKTDSAFCTSHTSVASVWQSDGQVFPVPSIRHLWTKLCI